MREVNVAEPHLEALKRIMNEDADGRRSILHRRARALGPEATTRPRRARFAQDLPVRRPLAAAGRRRARPQAARCHAGRPRERLRARAESLYVLECVQRKATARATQHTIDKYRSEFRRPHPGWGEMIRAKKQLLAHMYARVHVHPSGATPLGVGSPRSDDEIEESATAAVNDIEDDEPAEEPTMPTRLGSPPISRTPSTPRDSIAPRRRTSPTSTSTSSVI